MKPTIRQIAQETGLSIGTISRYLNGAQLKKRNAELIAEAIKRLDYTPNFLAKSLSDNRSYSIGILTESLGSVFDGSVISGIEAEMEDRGYTSIVIEYRSDLEALRNKVAFLRSRMIDGLVLVSPGFLEEELGFLSDLGIPVVVVDSPGPGPDVDSVVVDNEQASARAVGAMLAVGHRRVGVVAPPAGSYVGTTRLQGWRCAYAEAGLVPFEGDIRFGGNKKTGGYRAALELLNAGEVTALFACNYYMGLGVLKAINERELAVGRDIGFACFDDFDFSDVTNPPLTVVKQPVGAIAARAAELMLARLDGGAPNGEPCVLESEVRITDSILGRL